MIKKENNFLYRSRYALSVLVKSKTLMPFFAWLNFWITSEPVKRVRIGECSFYVRGNSLANKLIDIYVILENSVDQAYSKGFTPKKDATIIDIGGHIGAFSVNAGTQITDGIIYAFEPFAENFNFLKKNIELNKLNNVVPINCAVASSNGDKVLYLDNLNSSGHSLTKASGNPVKVTSTTLADFFKEKNIERCNFLKMDCEGSEYDIILNTPEETLKKIDYMIFEYHMPSFFGLGDDSLYDRLLEKLKKCGFAVTAEKENYQRGYIRASQLGLTKQ